jgi:hypothetical protein
MQTSLYMPLVAHRFAPAISWQFPFDGGMSCFLIDAVANKDAAKP